MNGYLTCSNKKRSKFKCKHCGKMYFQNIAKLRIYLRNCYEYKRKESKNKKMYVDADVSPTD